ncbi:hypothetical protein SynA1825c_02526 [Synechococcus sp. A18-25c]|nr:hypothetical protein SynA1825c_02526 [Synechococcus sp. A18-25c]
MSSGQTLVFHVLEVVVQVILMDMRDVLPLGLKKTYSCSQFNEKSLFNTS